MKDDDDSSGRTKPAGKYGADGLTDVPDDGEPLEFPDTSLVIGHLLFESIETEIEMLSLMPQLLLEQASRQLVVIVHHVTSISCWD